METSPPSVAKRPCPYSSSSSSPSHSPNASFSTPNTNHYSQVEYLLDSFLPLADSPALPLTLNCSFDRILDSLPGDEDQSRLIDRAFKVGSLLLQSANRSARKRAAAHNSHSWPLPPDLTMKVFSMLDTQSLCYAAAACSMFNKCAMDPSCYANIDLTTVVHKVNNAVVYMMIRRAGKALRSLKLGTIVGPTSPSYQSMVHIIKNTTNGSSVAWTDKRTRKGKGLFSLTRSCLNPLNDENGATGALLRRLHLYNLELMDNTSLRGALSACPKLLDLKLVGLHVGLTQILASVTENCHLIEHLFFESSKTGRDESLKSPACIDFVNNCPNLTSLALRGFKLHDYKVRILVKGFRKLKRVDFSTSYLITGQFLRNLGSSTAGNLLEVLLLRDCMHLKEAEVARFLSALISGDFKPIRHIDISNREGLASEGDWYQRCYSPNRLPLKEVMEERPGVRLLAEFPSEESIINLEQMLDSDLETPSDLSSHSSDGSFLLISAGSTHNSDHGSGNEESVDSQFVALETSSEDADFMACYINH